MFTGKPKEESAIDNAIEDAFLELKGYDSSDEGYDKMIRNLETLHKLKQMGKPSGVSRDTLAVVLGNLAGILIIVSHEHANVITSKAMNFILKAR